MNHPNPHCKHHQEDSAGHSGSLTVGQKALLMLIRGYQLTLSPWIGRQCRFYPTCSHYAAEAITRHGVITGSRLMVARLAKCHPFNPGGVDLVPDPNVPTGASTSTRTYQN